MSDILTTILDHKKSELRALRDRRSSFRGRPSAPRPFGDALRLTDRLGLIAEVKKASPSKGLIAEQFDPVAIAGKYQSGGASAISVLTDRKFFQGGAEVLVDVRQTVELAVLRKDFIIDPLQVEETAALDADAMLLIAAALSDEQMAELHAAARELSVETLLEIHSGSELDRVMKLEPAIVGINNRDLAAFTVDLKVTRDLARAIPQHVIVVSESGIASAADAAMLADAGVDAILVGEALMRSADPAKLLGELRCARPDKNLRHNAV